ncbi:MAG: VWA domain-containing protein [Verrucomicrobiota bacterium]|jgi:Ca-activated chloride channel family protein
MTFAHPYVLLAWLLLPVLAWLKGKWGQNASFLYSSVELVRPVSSFKRSRAGRILAALRWLALILFILALAQPRRVRGETQVKASGIDIVVAIDLSGSMASEDFQENGHRVNRINLAREVLTKFIDGRPSDRIGLVVFAAKAFIASPLTLDHDFLQASLARLYLGVIDENQTAIGSALMAALNQIRDIQSKSKIIILMTDGENNAGKVSPLTAAEIAQTLNVKIYTIGIGIRGMAPMPVGKNPITGETEYRNFPADVDEDTLQKIASMTGGKYYRADSADTMRRIYAEIDRYEKNEVEVKKYEHFDELFRPVALAGLAVLLLELVLGQTVWRRLP